MTVVRDHLLVNYPKFPAPFSEALRNRGIKLVGNDWKPAPELLQRALACIVDFGGSVKHPLRALRWQRRLARHRVPVFSWNRDAPHNNNLPHWRLGLFALLRPLDIYATHNLADKRWDFANTVFFLPNAADIGIYNVRGESRTVLANLRDSRRYLWDVSFFGALDGGRYKEAIARRVFFDELGSRLDALGISHRFVDTTRAGLSWDEQVTFIQTSRINLNFGARCDYGSDTPAGLPERCYGIPACGGFLLTDRRIHTADSFTVGRHIDDFANIGECVEKISLYLRDFGRLRAIAEAGWEHVMQCHTYRNRAEELHLFLLHWHDQQRRLLPHDAKPL